MTELKVKAISPCRRTAVRMADVVRATSVVPSVAWTSLAKYSSSLNRCSPSPARPTHPR